MAWASSIYYIFMGLIYLIAFVFAIKCILFIGGILYKIYNTCYQWYSLEYNINQVAPVNDTVMVKINKHEIPTYIVFENPSYPKYTISMVR